MAYAPGRVRESTALRRQTEPASLEEGRDDVKAWPLLAGAILGAGCHGPCVRSHTEMQYQAPLVFTPQGSPVSIPIGNGKLVPVEVCDEYAERGHPREKAPEPRVEPPPPQTTCTFDIKTITNGPYPGSATSAWHCTVPDGRSFEFMIFDNYRGFSTAIGEFDFAALACRPGLIRDTAGHQATIADLHGSRAEGTLSYAQDGTTIRCNLVNR